MAVVCPRLNPFARNPDVITSLNQYELRLSSYQRTPGTEVQLSCIDDLQLQGQKVITCQTDGHWSFDSRPYCAKPPLYDSTDNPEISEFTEDVKILIGVLVTVTSLVTIVMIVLSCLIRRKMNELRKQQKLQKDFSDQLDEEKREKGKVYINNNHIHRSLPHNSSVISRDGFKSQAYEIHRPLHRNSSVTSRDPGKSQEELKGHDDTISYRSNLQRQNTNRFSPNPNPAMQKSEHHGRARRHSDGLHSIMSRDTSPFHDNTRVFPENFVSNKLDGKNSKYPTNNENFKGNGRRQRSHSEDDARRKETQSPEPEMRRPSRGSQVSSLSPIFTVSCKTTGNAKRNSISDDVFEKNHSDLTEINTDAMSYGRDPFLWKSVYSDWET